MQFQLIQELLARELKNRFLSSLSGGVWLLLHPVLLLAVYSLVFVHIFKARMGQGADIAFLPFFAVALWPWLAFSEGLVRSLNAIPENAGLLSKVKFPKLLIVVTPILATFLVHGLGMLLVCLLLTFAGHSISFIGLALAVLPYLGLMMLCLGLAMLLASLNVFVRDLAQGVPQVIGLLFFLTPIMYTRDLLPEDFRWLADGNPIGAWVESIRALVLQREMLPLPSGIWLTGLVTVAIAGIGYWVFRRLSPHFEDFI